jgi:GST-like protein
MAVVMTSPGARNDRSALLDHLQRPQSLDFPGRSGPAVQDFPGQHRANEQFEADFLKISPNNKIPAIVDHEPADGGEPLNLFESGAILLYLAEKTGQFIAKDLRGRQETLQWLFWQMGGLGPMAGQNHHFNRFAKEKIPYAINRYVDETARLYGVLNERLADRSFVAGEDYGIADMAIYPWIVPHTFQEQNLDDFPHLKRWFETVANRDAVKRAYALADKINPPKP